MTKNSPVRWLCLGLIVLASCCLLSLAHANETRWTGEISGDWFDADNWTNGVPDANTDAVIDNNSPRGPSLGGELGQVRNLHMDRRNLQIGGGSRLEAANIFVEFGGGPGDIDVSGDGSQLTVSGDIVFGGARAPASSDDFDLRVVSVRSSGHLRVEGTLQLGDLESFGNFPPLRVVNVDIQGTGSLIELGTLDAAVLATSLFNWQEGTVRIFNEITVARRNVSFPVEEFRQFAINLGGRFGSIGPAPVLDMVGENPAFRLINPMSVNLIQLVAEQAEYRLENLAGEPFSILGGFEVVDLGPGHTVSNGHHEVEVWRIEDGSAEFNGSVNGLVELGFGLALNGTAEFSRLHSQGVIQVGNPDQIGTMRITEEFVQSTAGVVRIRVAEDDYDQLLSTGAMSIQGGTIEITVEENAQPGTYVVLSNQLGFQEFGAAVEVVNHSNLLAQTTVTANQVRIELTGRGELDLSATAMEFGSVAVGSSSHQSITLGNTGQAALVLAVQSATPEAFSIVGGSCPTGFSFLLPPGDSCTLMLRFEPSAAGETLGVLSLLLPEDDLVRTVELRGRGNTGPSIFSDRFQDLP